MSKLSFLEQRIREVKDTGDELMDTDLTSKLNY
jgi:hypothetical protein